MKRQFVKTEVITDDSGYFCADQCPYAEIGWCNLLQIMFDKEIDIRYAMPEKCHHRRPFECIETNLHI